MKDLRQVTVIGLGLLGGSITLGISRSFRGVKTVGYTHRAATRRKSKDLAVASEIVDDMNASVCGADLVILATPIRTFEKIFGRISDSLRPGCIVTDVGSTKVLVHKWAAKMLPRGVHYVGSHPIAGSEQRGVEFARDDLFDQATCILTTTKNSNRRAIDILKGFWSDLGCSVRLMRPRDHDRIFANVSHLPHIVAASLINANSAKDLKSAGKGFMDTSRIASGPANIWADVLLTNATNTTKGIDKIIAELLKLKKAIKNGNERQIEKLLEAARVKRATLIKEKIRRKELIS
ncbi:MAG: prephenate dehydrogenase [Planctomycetota bacterium]